MIGLVLLAALALGGGKRSTRALAGRWVWPMPRLPDGRAPVITDGYHVRPSGKLHAAVDLMYRRRQPVTGKPPLPDHGSRNFEVPEGTQALAAAAGKVWATGKDDHGHFVVLDHGKSGWSTVYRHLDRLAIPAHKAGKLYDGGAPLVVAPGDVLGDVGWDPLDPQQLRHLHFELRDGKDPVDPEARMSAWEVLA